MQGRGAHAQISYHTHDGPPAPVANMIRSCAAWAAIAAPSTPTVSRTAWGLRTERPTDWATVAGVNVVEERRIREVSSAEALGAAVDTMAGRVERVHVHLDLDVLDPEAVGPANEFAPEGSDPCRVGSPLSLRLEPGLSISRLRTMLKYTVSPTSNGSSTQWRFASRLEVGCSNSDL